MTGANHSALAPSGKSVLVLNNYSFERVGREVAAGEKPRHHLYAVDKLPRDGWDVHLAPFDERKSKPRRSGFIRRLIPLGDLAQQWYAWRHRHQADVIYSPCQTQTHVLSYLRALGLFRVPIVMITHHPMVYGRGSWLRRWWVKWELAGVDACGAMNKGVAHEIDTLTARPGWCKAMHWGADLSYYPSPDGSPGKGAISAGRTGRDFITFAKAAAHAGIPSEVMCLADDPVVSLKNLPADVKVTAVRNESDLTYSKLVPHLAQARVHAIPLHAGKPLAGLTSLVDSLALGKPVIMTRNRLIDVDLEKEGIGRWVDAGDVEGWVDALRWFETHPDESAQMGQQARQIAEELWNDEVFAREADALLHEALGQKKALRL